MESNILLNGTVFSYLKNMITFIQIFIKILLAIIYLDARKKSNTSNICDKKQWCTTRIEIFQDQYESNSVEFLLLLKHFFLCESGNLFCQIKPVMVVFIYLYVLFL